MRILKTAITITIISLFASCSGDSDSNSETENYEISSMSPNFGYSGDEITFNMSSSIPTNASVGIKYDNQSAQISEINGTIIKHIMPNNVNASKTLTINNQNITIEYLYGLKEFINCDNCKEKAFMFSNSEEIESAITSVFKINNEIYLIKTSRNNNYEYKTSLLKTDLDFNLINEVVLFNKLPMSETIFNNTSFVTSNADGVYSYNYNGNLIWSYNTTLINGADSINSGILPNSILKFNSYYYILKNPQNVFNNDEIEIIKINSNGQYVSNILIPNPAPQPNTNSQSAYTITSLDNKIVVFTSFCCDNSYADGGYAIIDQNDNIIRNTYNQISMLDSSFFTENNSVYFTRYISGSYPNSIFELVKISLDNNNYFQTDWVKSDYYGNIIKYNNKYLSIQVDKILIFNDNNFNNPTIFNASIEYFEGISRTGLEIFDNYIYLFGQRTIEFANDYHSLVGKYDLNYITE